MQKITGFVMKDCLSLTGPKYFKSLGNEEDELIYTYKDKYMRWFVRQSTKGGRVCAFNQQYKSEKICDDILKTISEKLNVKRKLYDIVDAYLEYKKNFLKYLKKNT